MFIKSFVIATAVLATLTTAVDITVYPKSTDCDDKTGGVVCRNIATQNCCRSRAGDFFSAKFSGLNVGKVQTGIVFTRANGQDCGKGCNSKSNGPVVCIDPGSCPAAQGASWYAARPFGTKQEQEVTGSKECVDADVAFFGNGRTFRVNYDVPSNITNMIFDLIKSDPQLAEGIPTELEAFEVTN